MLTAEDNKINLNALKNQDPFATKIHETALRVAVYKFLSKKNEWKKLDVEGSLFVFERMVEPLHSFVVMNTLALHLFLQPITSDLEFQDRNPFLLYKTTSDIYGIWFIDSTDCERVKSLLINLTAQAKLRKEKRDDSSGTLDQTNVTTVKNDIMLLLSKAQNTYHLKQQDDNQQLPKQIANWPNDYDNMVKPAPIRVQTTTNAPLDTSSSSCTSNTSELKPQQQQTNQVNPILKRLLSNENNNTQPIGINDTSSSINAHELISLDLKRKLNILKDDSSQKNHNQVSNNSGFNINILNMNGNGTNGTKNLITVKDFEENLLNESSVLKQSKAPTPRVQETMFYLEESTNPPLKQPIQLSNRPTNLLLNDLNEPKSFPQHRSSFSESSHDSLNSPVLPLLLTPAAFETCSQLTNTFFSNGNTASGAQTTSVELLFKTHQTATTTTNSQLPTSSNVSEINTTNKSASSLLTKAQLQYLLIDLIKNDDKFVQSIHDAYIQTCLQRNLKLQKD